MIRYRDGDKAMSIRGHRVSTSELLTHTQTSCPSINSPQPLLSSHLQKKKDRDRINLALPFNGNQNRCLSVSCTGLASNCHVIYTILSSTFIMLNLHMTPCCQLSIPRRSGTYSIATTNYSFLTAVQQRQSCQWSHS
jgi:hypothetical protein